MIQKFFRLFKSPLVLLLGMALFLGELVAVGDEAPQGRDSGCGRARKENAHSLSLPSPPSAIPVGGPHGSLTTESSALRSSPDGVGLSLSCRRGGRGRLAVVLTVWAHRPPVLWACRMGGRIDGFVDVFVFHVVEIRVVPAHVGVDRRTLELSHMGVNIMVVTFGVIGHGCSIPLYEDSIADRKASEGIGFVRSSLDRTDGMRNGVLRRYL